MTVCACQNLTLDEIIEAMERCGDDAETICEHSGAGKGCGECLDPTCEAVDLPFSHALANARAILQSRR